MANKAIVLAVDERTFSAVELVHSHSGIEIVRYLVQQLPLTGIDPSELRKLWFDTGFSQQQAVLTIPGDMVKIKSVLVPKLPEEQLEAAVQIELESRENHGEIAKIVNWQPQDEMILVKVALVNNERLSQLIAKLREAGIGIRWSGLRMQAIQNFLNFNAGDFLSEEPLCTAYIDLDYQKTDFGVINGEELLYRRDFTPGLHEIGAGATEVGNDFMEELRLSFASYQAGTGRPPLGALWLFGNIDSAKKLLQQMLVDSGYEILIPDNSRIAGVIVANHHLPLVAPLIGLGLEELGCFDHQGYRFHSRDQAALAKGRQRVICAGKIGVIITLLIGGVFLGTHSKLEKDQKIQEWLNQKADLLAGIQRTEQRGTRDLEKVRQLEDWLADQGNELEFLRLLQDNLPEGTLITDLTLEDGAVKDISGTTPSVSVMFERLRRISGFESLKLKGTITITDQGEMFHIEGPLRIKERAK